MSEKTIFQKIIDREIPAPLVYEDELVAAFNDINAQAPIHVLIVPKKLIPRVGEAGAEDQATLGALLLAAGKIADKLGIKEKPKAPPAPAHIPTLAPGKPAKKARQPEQIIQYVQQTYVTIIQKMEVETLNQTNNNDGDVNNAIQSN